MTVEQKEIRIAAVKKYLRTDKSGLLVLDSVSMQSRIDADIDEIALTFGLTKRQVCVAIIEILSE